MSTLADEIMKELSQVLTDGGELTTPHCCQKYAILAHRAAIEIAYLEAKLDDANRLLFPSNGSE